MTYVTKTLFNKTHKKKKLKKPFPRPLDLKNDLRGHIIFKWTI